MSRRPFGIFLVFCSIFLFSCSVSAQLTPTLPPTSSPEIKEPEITALPSETPTAIALPEETPQPGPTLAPGIGADCVAPAPDLTLESGDYENLPARIQAFLNTGGSPAGLDNALYDTGVASQPRAVVTGNLDGDGKTDVIVSVFDPTSQWLPPAGRLLVFTCSAGQYTEAYRIEATEELSGSGIRFVQDLNADGLDDLVSSQGICGAHTCYERLQILTWTGAALENRLDGNTQDLPYPDYSVDDPDGDGLFDLSVTGGAVGSVGAGPQRPLTRVFRFAAADGWWRLAEELVGESGYRIHALHDADSALREARYADARALYERIITDQPPLADWADPAVEQANLAAFARFRLMQVALLQGDTAGAQVVLSELGEVVADDSPQQAIVQMASLYLETYLNNGREAACSALAGSSADFTPVLDALGQTAFGYMNPNYTIEQACP